MAKIIIENTREHDITISVFTPDPAKNGEENKKGTGTTKSLTIPGARQSKDDKNVLVNGRAEAEDSFIEAAQKASEVVAHYFDEGWLVTSRTGKK